MLKASISTHCVQGLAVTQSHTLEADRGQSWRQPEAGVEPVPGQVRVSQERVPALQLEDPVSTVHLMMSASKLVDLSSKSTVTWS